MSNFIEYLKETKAEMKHVTWPTKEQVISHTAVVIGLSIFSALLLAAFDAAFTYLFDALILQ